MSIVLYWSNYKFWLPWYLKKKVNGPLAITHTSPVSPLWASFIPDCLQFGKGYRAETHEFLEVLQVLSEFFWGKGSWSLPGSHRNLWSLFKKVTYYRYPRIWFLREQDTRLSWFFLGWKGVSHWPIGPSCKPQNPLWTYLFAYKEMICDFSFYFWKCK